MYNHSRICKVLLFCVSFITIEDSIHEIDPLPVHPIKDHHVKSKHSLKMRAFIIHEGIYHKRFLVFLKLYAHS